MISVPLGTTPAPDEPTITDIEFWQEVGVFFVGVGWKLLTVASIIIGAFILAWILRFVIHRVVSRIVNGAKNKANVDDTQALVDTLYLRDSELFSADARRPDVRWQHDDVRNARDLSLDRAVASAARSLAARRAARRGGP